MGAAYDPTLGNRAGKSKEIIFIGCIQILYLRMRNYKFIVFNRLETEGSLT